MTSGKKNPWRRLLLGFLLPAVLLWLGYFLLVDRYFLHIFRFTGARAEFSRDFFRTDLAKRFPAVDLVVLGDSTAKSAVNPLGIPYAFAINLGLNGGTALTSFEMLDRYLRAHPAPKCVLYVSQYNWQRNYAYFFERVVSFRSLDWRNLADVWRRGIREGIYPRTEFSTLGFFTATLRYYLFLGELPLNLMQRAFWKNPIAQQARWDRFHAVMIANRGFQDNEMRKVLPEDDFFNGNTHEAYLAPFRPYETEDYYINELIKTTGERGVKLLWAMLPLADSDSYLPASVHQAQRDLHVLKLMQGRAHVVQVPVPLKMPRRYFYDFTHFTPEGAKALQPYLDPSLKEHCAR